ncbi:hypothetical protein FQR65_LT20725 [Abscondita terminalis]|nr:hypothetical protein FQR65_LT20725 [Abscondita terminalis]
MAGLFQHISRQRNICGNQPGRPPAPPYDFICSHIEAKAGTCKALSGDAAYAANLFATSVTCTGSRRQRGDAAAWCTLRTLLDQIRVRATSSYWVFALFTDGGGEVVEPTGPPLNLNSTASNSFLFHQFNRPTTSSRPVQLGHRFSDFAIAFDFQNRVINAPPPTSDFAITWVPRLRLAISNARRIDGRIHKAMRVTIFAVPAAYKTRRTRDACEGSRKGLGAAYPHA